MAGLYIHVPFCQKRCLYCDFYSNTDMGYRENYIRSLIREMELRHDVLRGEPLETIYFGGGTPSQLTADDFAYLFEQIERCFAIAPNPEITIEANPDDLTPAYTRALGKLPFNRLSMGVQSFDPQDLRFLNRRHDREQAIRAVELCRDAGIWNISIDLIYGLPGQTLEKWNRNLDEALALQVPHISAYHLIYEEGTALYKLREAGRVMAVDEETSLALFSRLIHRLKDAGYLHYEISNFAREGFISRHNSAYWKGIPYLGLGPSAHSFYGSERSWNVASLPRWMEGLNCGKPALEVEAETPDVRYNDYIITGLRTMWGIDLMQVERDFGSDRRRYCEEQALPHINRGKLVREGDRLRLSEQGIFISDGIMSDLLWV